MKGKLTGVLVCQEVKLKPEIPPVVEPKHPVPPSPPPSADSDEKAEEEVVSPPSREAKEKARVMISRKTSFVPVQQSHTPPVEDAEGGADSDISPTAEAIARRRDFTRRYSVITKQAFEINLDLD